MQPSVRSPYEGKLCRIMIKSTIIFSGKLTSNFVEARIKMWAREGVYLDEGSFIPWSTVGALAPLEALDPEKKDTRAVELTRDEIWYLWHLARDDHDSCVDAKMRAIAASARDKLLKSARSDSEK